MILSKMFQRSLDLVSMLELRIQRNDIYITVYTLI